MRNLVFFFTAASASCIVAFIGCSSNGSSGATGSTSASSGAPIQSSSSASTSATTSSVSTSSESSSSGSGGTGGSGGSTVVGDCNVPLPAPSHGSCVTPVLVDGGEADAGVDDAGNASTTTCNPITNAGCTGTDVCMADFDFTNYYCQPAGTPANIPLCASCTGFATCAPGGLCVGTDEANVTCAPMCCDDADCAPSGTCDKTSIPMPAGVGYCRPK